MHTIAMTLSASLLSLPLLINPSPARAESTADDSHARSGNRQFEYHQKPGAEADTVVILHGLGRNRSAMWTLAKRLELAGYRTERFGYRSLHKSPEEIVSRLDAQVAACCAGSPRKVHFVGHSLGGLIARAYLAKHKLPNLGRVVLLGTPSQGSELADAYENRWWFEYLGPTVKQLGTSAGGLAGSLPKPDYPVGVIAGVRSGRENEDVLPGQDDGLVTVSSTRFSGMTDFMVMPTTHWGMRYSEPVAAQVVNFLKTGHFEKGR
ncbi:MAG: alpha/beta hydrolase family protein [Pseudomonadota bacterium]